VQGGQTLTTDGPFVETKEARAAYERALELAHPSPTVASSPAAWQNRAESTSQFCKAEAMAVNVAEAPSAAASPTIPRDQVIVLFGATGDLAKRKLLPGIFHLFEAGLMPERFVLIGASRGGLSEDEFVAYVRAELADSGERLEDWDTAMPLWQSYQGLKRWADLSAAA